MENDFIFWTAVILAFIMTIVALCTTKYAADVKENTLGFGTGWNEFKRWKKNRDDLLHQSMNWEKVLKRIEEAAKKREDNPDIFPDPVKAEAVQLINDYTLTKND